MVPHLRFLRLLVAGLAVVMGAGIIAIAAILWLRLSAPVLPDLPATITLPQGAIAQAVTFAPDYIVVVTQAGAVLFYDRASGALLREIQP